MSGNNQRGSPLPQPPRSSDIGWKFGTPTGTRNHIICNFCNKEITGGITRLKQHLAGIRGNTQPCTEVAAEVRKEMNNHIRGKKEALSVSSRRREEVEESLRMGGNANFVDGKDADITIARRESLRSLHEFEERQQRRAGGGYDAAYEPGGGSSAHQSSGRRASVSDAPSHEIGRRMWQQSDDLDTPEARLKRMDANLERSKSSKQPKLVTSSLKKARNKLKGAISRFIIHTGLPARITKSLYFKPMLDTAAEVGRNNIVVPSAYEVTGPYLEEEYQVIKTWLSVFKKVWVERGVTVMLDGWSDMNRRHIINFMVYCPKGTVFHKSIDVSEETTRDANFYFSIMDEVVEEIGEQNVVQVVTDNEAAVKAGGRKLMAKRKHLYWAPCSAHCLDLILKDIGAKDNVSAILEDARSISGFIYNHTWTLAYMRKFTNNREILRPAVTRFATNFIALESLLKQRGALKEMVHSREWRKSKYSKLPGAKTATKHILSDSFWKKVGEICKILEPLVRVLKLCDGDDKPTMGFLYEAMDRAKLAIKENHRSFQQYWKIIDSRWTNLLHHDLHSAGYYFNPQFHYGGNTSDTVRNEVREGVKRVIMKLEPEMGNQIKCLNQLFTFEDADSTFGVSIAQQSINLTHPAEWWMLHGGCAPELQRIAVRVLSQTTSATNCERNWSTFSYVHTKRRNRLAYRKVQKLVYVHYNMKLKVRGMERRSAAEMEHEYTPINLDYIFEEDPMEPWIQESEQPLMDKQPDLPAGLFEATEDEAEDDVGDETDGSIPIDEEEEEESEGLSPIDDNDASASGSGSGNIGGYENEHNYQSASFHDYPGDEIPAGQAIPQSSTPPHRVAGRGGNSGQARTHYNQPSEGSSSSNHDIVDHFGNLSYGESSSHTTQNYPPHYGSYNPSWSPSSQLQNQDLQWWNLMGQSWQHGREQHHSYPDHVSSPPPSPPRHSFWW